MQKNKAEEQGMALIVTLGILSMLLVLALAFASSARTERKAAAANANSTVARLLAESGVKRVIALMNYYDVNGFQVDGIASNTSGSETDWIHRLSTSIDGTSIYSWSSDTPGTDQPTWENISIDGQILGRMAYRVVAGGGRLDPAACVKSTIDENNPNLQERPGVEVDEIMLKDADPTGSYISATNCTDLGFVDSGGKLTNGTRWTDFPQLFSLVGVPDASKPFYYSVFVLDQGQIREAFWIDSNNNGKKDSSEWYKRFNLARTDWNDNFASDGNGAEGDLDSDGDTDRNDHSIAFMTDYILNDPLTFVSANDPSPATISDGIKWINDWTEPGTYTNADARKKQIAANLIDYCDNDGSGTDDPSNAGYVFNPTRDSSSNPTYMGLEKTPYINEIGINVECTMSVNKEVDAGPVNERFDFQYDFAVIVDAEKIDIYPGNFSKDAILTITEGLVSYTWTDAAGTATSATKTLNGTSISIGDDADAYAHFAAPGPSWVEDTVNTWSNWQPVANADLTGTVTNVKVQIQKVSLHYDVNGNGVANPQELADFSKPDKATEYSEEIPVLVDKATPTNDSWFSYQANDPRQNLNPDDWKQAKADLVGSGGAYGDGGPDYGTPDAVNSSTIMNIGSSGDTEVVSDPGYVGAASNQHISTAYVANLPIASPWELGAIHRGGAWETLNLQKHNASASGGGAYASGDANILDQIKMSGDYQKYGKVGINTNDNNVLRALLARIIIGNQYIDPGDTAGGGAEVNINDIVNNVIPNITSIGTKKRRSEVANATSLFDGSCGQTQNTDALKEELIGKFINLTTAESSSYSAIILAQTIKDVGTSTANEIIIYKDLDVDGIPKEVEADITEPYDIDGDNTSAFTDPNKDGDNNAETIGTQKNRYDQFADEIIGEQKMILYTKRDATTGKWIVVRYEFLND